MWNWLVRFRNNRFEAWRPLPEEAASIPLLIQSQLSACFLKHSGGSMRDAAPLGGWPQHTKARGGRKHDVPVGVVLWSQDDDS